MFPKSKKHKNCLWQHFGLTAFKPLQWQIISSIIEPRGERNDVCAVIATGYGKSLSYQYPAFYLNKVVLVISPLIALMEDQVAALNERSQPNDCACLLGTAQEDRGIKQRILRCQYKLVYATPEYITRGNGLKLLHDLGQNLALIAIDEAHCISKWGHEFRPAYRQLQQLRAAVPHVRLLALTGTATRRVRLDICQQLELHKPLLLCCPIDRANLELTVRPKSDDLWSDLQQYLSWATEAAGAVIIYNNTIKETQLMAKRLTQLGRPCHSYHSKLPLEQKRRHQQEFSEDRVRCMAATTAFGMGIDKPNVRLVVHYGAPSDMERYYQEIGRAGRDGLPAKCVLFYGDTDAALHQRLQQSQALTAERSEELQQLARSMQSYIESSECRRQFILKYFDDATSLSNWQWRGNCCDNCRKARQLRGHTEHPLPTQFDVGREARLLLGMLRDVNGRVGYGKLILALRGSRNKCVNSACREHEHFGQGAHRSITWYKALAEHLKAMGYIKDEYQKSGTSAYGYLMPQVTLKGCCWLDNDKTEGTLLIEPSPRLAKLLFKRKKKSKSSKSPRNSKDEDKDLKLDWGSDIDLSELDEKVEQQLEEQQRAAVTDNVWGPDIDIDFQQIDAAVAQQQMTKLNDQHQDQDLASLLADCQKILHEEQEHATRTLKARKRVWEYLEGSYQKMPLIPKYKYSSQPRKAN